MLKNPAELYVDFSHKILKNNNKKRQKPEISAQNLLNYDIYARWKIGQQIL